jgi:hypothetical protein
VASDELVRPTDEDLRWKATGATRRIGALHGDGLERESPDAGWNVVAASLTCDDEGLPLESVGNMLECRR